jgi:ABC-type phosphonate transport system ATPase subunit
VNRTYPTPEWVTVGTQVVVYSYRHYGGIRARLTTIERVTPTQFRIAGDDRPWWHTKGTSDNGAIARYDPTQHVMALDSPHGGAMWDRACQAQRIQRLRSAASAFDRKVDAESLTQLRDTLAELREGDIR